MSDIRTRPEYRKHPDEKFLDALEERFKRDLESLVNFATTDGRVIFQVPLSDEEKWQRFSNPATRARMLERILKVEGPQGVRAYVESMTKIAQKVLKDDPEGTGPRSNLQDG